MFDNVVKFSLDFSNYAQPITTYKSRMFEIIYNRRKTRHS